MAKDGPKANPTDYRSGKSNVEYKKQRKNYDLRRYRDGKMTKADYIVKHGDVPTKRKKK